MVQSQAKFEPFVWECELTQLENLFDAIDDFLNDERARKFHLGQKYKNNNQFGGFTNTKEDSAKSLSNGV